MIFLTCPPVAPGAGFLSAILHFSSLRSFTALKVQLRKMACYLQGEPHDASLMAQRQPNFLKQRFSYEAFFYCVTPEINKNMPWETQIHLSSQAYLCENLTLLTIIGN
jgi:hypothetical protein